MLGNLPVLIASLKLLQLHDGRGMWAVQPFIPYVSHVSETQLIRSLPLTVFVSARYYHKVFWAGDCFEIPSPRPSALRKLAMAPNVNSKEPALALRIPLLPRVFERTSARFRQN